MAITETQQDNLTAFIGEGNIYVGPLSAVPADGARLTLTAGVPPVAFTNVGLTNGKAELDIQQTIEGYDVEQASGKVAPRIKEEKATLKCSMAESTYANLALAMANATTGTDGTPTPNLDYMTVGGNITVTPKCVVLVAPVDDGARYEYVVLYRAVAKGSKVAWKRGENHPIDVEFTAYHDVTRAKGDMLLQFCQQKAAP